MEDPTMDWKVEKHPSDEDDGMIGWIWSKGVSFGKKILVAGFVVSSAPLVVPPLVVASTIVVISSVPYCLFLASYACTEKLMSALLPSAAPPPLSLYGEGVEKTVCTEKDKSSFEVYDMEGKKLSDDEAVTRVDEASPVAGTYEPSHDQVSPILIQIEGEELTVRDEGGEKTIEVTKVVMDVYEPPGIPEDEEMVQETRSLTEKMRNEDKTDEALDKSTDEKSFKEDKKPIVSGTEREKVWAGVGVLLEKKEKPETRRVHEQGKAGQRKQDKQEGKIYSTTDKTSTGKDEETTQNEPIDQAVSAPCGTGEEKRKNSNKKKRKTGSSVMYSEEEIWEKMEAVRKIVGYRGKRSATCAEELNSLYVFIGVEPSESMKDCDNHDVAKVSDRLRFLMSIIGIK